MVNNNLNSESRLVAMSLATLAKGLANAIFLLCHKMVALIGALGPGFIPVLSTHTRRETHAVTCMYQVHTHVRPKSLSVVTITVVTTAIVTT
jgi:hypothetical protein